MAKNPEQDQVLSVADVCAILKSCAENQVSSMQWRDLEVTFHQSVKPEPITVGESAPPLTLTEHETQSQRALERDELDLRDDQFATLPIENPVEYEEQLRDGEDLDDIDDDDGDSE